MNLGKFFYIAYEISKMYTKTNIMSLDKARFAVIKEIIKINSESRISMHILQKTNIQNKENFSRLKFNKS